MPRNNEDFAQGRGIMSNINDSMEMLDAFVIEALMPPTFSDSEITTSFAVSLSDTLS